MGRFLNSRWTRSAGFLQEYISLFHNRNHSEWYCKMAELWRTISQKIRKQRWTIYAAEKKLIPGKSALSDIAAVEQSHLILPPKTPTFHLSYHWQELPCEVTAWCLNKWNWFPSPKGCPIRCGRQWNHPFATDTLYYSKRTSRRMKSEKKFTLMLPEPCLPNSWKTWIPYNNYLPK